MNQMRNFEFSLGSTLLTLGFLEMSTAQAQAPPLLGPLSSDPIVSSPATAGPSMPHEVNAPALRPTAADRIAQAPPAPIDETPSADRPSRSSTWVEGYWDWDASQADFAWVPGTWREPPPDKIWLNGSWRRDQTGWYRVPGRWIDRPGARITSTPIPTSTSIPTQSTSTSPADPPRVAVDWKNAGPPAGQPDTTIPSAPAPDTFWIPGRWAPEGDGVVAWRPGFWARSQAGWDWLPGHWVRRADGWSYVDGRWDRVVGDSSSSRVIGSTPLENRTPDGRYTVARPPFDSAASTDLQPLPDVNLAPRTSGEPPYYGSVTNQNPYLDPYSRPFPGNDPIAEAEAGPPPYGRYPYPPPYRPGTYIRTPFGGPPIRIFGPRDAMNLTRSILNQVLP